MADGLLERLRRFGSDAFPQYRDPFQQFVAQRCAGDKMPETGRRRFYCPARAAV